MYISPNFVPNIMELTTCFRCCKDAHFILATCINLMGRTPLGLSCVSFFEISFKMATLNIMNKTYYNIYTLDNTQTII
uniref:Uncharacterized protein n=1 Tax=Anguilla anguilla TaxID=7936 RepID=A0A0E9PNN6_ANGAN